jgi:2-dehydro-3-deoxy-D-arabinonate dehydratase
MNLSRHSTPAGPRWAADGRFLPSDLTLSALLALPRAEMLTRLQSLPPGEPATGALLAPLDALHEVWAAGVTYLRSREARRAESAVASVYDKVYAAQRPELFFKAIGWRVTASGAPARIRRDSHWNVPEPELVLVANSQMEIVGYTAGNDLSSRDIEGENPLYLPQAKVYNGSCALGPAIHLAEAEELTDLPVRLEVLRQGAVLFQGETGIAQMKRGLPELVSYLGRELDFPHGALLMTGTGIVPGEDFTLLPGDRVRIQVGEIVLENDISPL